MDPIELDARARVGTVLLNKWRLERLLGVGGMGSVFAATHRNGSRAAIKILHAQFSANATVAQRFLSEGYVANAVGHPGVLKILDDDVADDGAPFLVSELLVGETLEERRIRLGGRMSGEDVLCVSDQILGILTAAHARGVLHCDLKPDNVFLTRHGETKLLDFGIARMRSRPGSYLAAHGVTMGTPSFMAPEQACGHEDEVDERSDLWSCGALMFNLLSGTLVHEGHTNVQPFSAISKSAPSILSAAPDVAMPIARVVDRALEFDKLHRWFDAASMQWAVREAYRETFGVVMSSAPMPNGATETVRIANPSRVTRSDRLPSSVRAGLVAAILPLCLYFVGERIARSHVVAANRVQATTERGVQAGVTVSESVETSREQESQGLPPTPSALSTSSVNMPLRNTSKRQYLTRPSVAPSRSIQFPTMAARSDCRVPFEIDVDTGKKRWLLDCL